MNNTNSNKAPAKIFARLKTIDVANYFVYFFATFTIYPLAFSTVAGILRKLEVYLDLKKNIFFISKEGLKAGRKIPYISLFAENTRNFISGKDFDFEYIKNLIIALLIALAVTITTVTIIYLLAYLIPVKIKKPYSKNDLILNSLSKLNFFNWNLSPYYVEYYYKKFTPTKLMIIISFFVSFILAHFIGLGSKRGSIVYFLTVVVFWLASIIVASLIIRFSCSVMGSLIFIKDKKIIDELEKERREEYKKEEKMLREKAIARGREMYKMAQAVGNAKGQGDKLFAYMLEAARLGSKEAYDFLLYAKANGGPLFLEDFQTYYNSKYPTITDISNLVITRHQALEMMNGEGDQAMNKYKQYNETPLSYYNSYDNIDLTGKVVHPDGSIHIDVSDV